MCVVGGGGGAGGDYDHDLGSLYVQIMMTILGLIVKSGNYQAEPYRLRRRLNLLGSVAGWTF